MTVTNTQELDLLVEHVAKAQAEFANFSQEQVDKIFRAAAFAAADARISLAKMAATETGMGVLEDKVIKNHFASEYIYNKYKDEKTCGILSEDLTFGTITIAEPVGIICGIVPTTNPTSTAIFKALISLKTRNGIIFSPHPRAKNSTTTAARIVLDAAVAAGAPKDIIGWIDQPSVALSNQLMTHEKINLILATGGPGMVKAAYSSGKPAIGVGAGNTPIVIDETADIKRAVSSILMSKTFDNGVVCASEQAVIVVESIYKQVKERFAHYGGYMLSKAETAAMQNVILKNGGLNADIVGQSAVNIALMAGISVPSHTKVLIGEVTDIDDAEAFAHEKLSPLLGMYKAKDFNEAMDKAEALVTLGGIGHTSGLYTDQDTQEARVKAFGFRMKTARILINTPASQGGIGDLYNFKLAPSLTLGGGSPMDAAKIIWVMYEHPDVDFADLALRFMDIRKRIYKFPKMGRKAKMVAIPTTSGTGSEVTPFAVVTDEVTGKKYPIADYELTPSMAIVDPNLVMDMPKSLTAFGGIDAVTHALEAYVSVMANEYSDGQALQALDLLVKYLPDAYELGAKAPVAREKVHNGATIAGIAFANAFLGVCHSMAHKLGAEFHLAHGLANALLISNVIRFNATDMPTKQAAFSQYDRPKALCRYAAISEHLKLGGKTDEQKVEKLIEKIEELKKVIGIPASIQEAGVNEADFIAKLDELAEDAFDDQCTGANPRYPLISEIKQVLLDSFYGRAYKD